mgnify:CR=1 FL=1
MVVPLNQEDRTSELISAGLILAIAAMTLEYLLMVSDRTRQRDLTQLTDLVANKVLKFLLASEHARVQQLTQQGPRKPKFL